MVYLIHENKKCNWGKLRDVKMNGYTNKERKGNDNRFSSPIGAFIFLIRENRV